MRIKTLLFVLLMFICIGNSIAKELTHEQTAAKEKGIILFNQYRIGEPYLRIAAEAGDADSQFYLAEELREISRFITPESYRWLEAAANQGHIHAMIRLGRSGNDLCRLMKGTCSEGRKTPVEWLNHAHEVTLPLAKDGDSEALFLMYEITSNSDWLDRAAEAGHALAQYRKAVSIQEGTVFDIFKNRKKMLRSGSRPLRKVVIPRVWSATYQYWQKEAIGKASVTGIRG